MSYKVEGRLLEVCTCNVLCPCWVGEDPDGGTCDGTLAWHVDHGEVEGVDVAGHTLTILCHIPGNILEGKWKARVYIDDAATEEQKNALIKVWTGELGGPIADMAKLIEEVVSVEQVPITFEVKGADGILKVGKAIDAGLRPFEGATGKATALHDSIFTTIPGSPAYVGKASHYNVDAPGFSIELKDHNAVSGQFRFEG